MSMRQRFRVYSQYLVNIIDAVTKDWFFNSLKKMCIFIHLHFYTQKQGSLKPGERSKQIPFLLKKARSKYSALQSKPLHTGKL